MPRIGAWRVDLAGPPRLARTGVEELLSQAEGKLIAFLIQHRGVCTSTREIAREVYGRTDPAADDLVRKVIDRCRAKLGEDASRIEHVQGKGYRLRDRGER